VPTSTILGYLAMINLK